MITSRIPPGMNLPKKESPKLPHRILGPPLRGHTAKSWLNDLVGKKFPDALKQINANHYPYRILKIDNVILDNGANGKPNELMLSLVSTQSFVPSGNYDKDRKRVSAWFCNNNDCTLVDKVLKV
jgi:hypothetical protein